MFECNSLLRPVFDAKYEFLIKETVPFIKKKLLYKYACVCCGFYFRMKQTHYTQTKKNSAEGIVARANLAKKNKFMCI